MKLNKQTLSEQIYQILRSDILSQRIPSGTKLTLKTLTTRFEVSSTPIREALTRLSEEQLVSYYSNIGVNVMELTRSDISEIYQFMGDLDALAIRYAAQSEKIHELVKELSGNISAAENALNNINVNKHTSESNKTNSNEYHTPDDGSAVRYTSYPPLAAAQGNETSYLNEFIKLSDEFHLIFYKYCNNSRLTRSAERMRSQMSIAAYQYEQNTDNLNPIHEEHVAIYKAFADGKHDEAVELMRLHMQHSMQYALELTSN